MASPRIRQLTAVVMEALIRASGWTTSAIVVLIVFFLFREGLGLFGSKPISEESVVWVHPSNPIDRLSSKQLRALHEKKITNWKELGGRDEKVFLFNLNNIDKFVKEKELGAQYERLSDVLKEVLNDQNGILAVFPEKYTPVSAKEIRLDPVTPWEFLFGREWYPTATPSPAFGALPLILGTLLVTLGAIVVALPLGLAVAIYLAELASHRVRMFIKPMVELLAGIPSVVFGFFGLVVIVPLIQKTFNLDVGETALAGSLLLGIIALPTIITVSEDALRATPKILKEASLGLGATHWQTISRVVVPYALNGISAAAILGVGRAVGETMTVLMVTGNAAVIPFSFLIPVRTLSATIAAELGEAPQGGLHYKALFMVGCVLFLVTFSFNLLAEYIASRSKFHR